jgi:hypothetical protein
VRSSVVLIAASLGVVSGMTLVISAAGRARETPWPCLVGPIRGRDVRRADRSTAKPGADADERRHLDPKGHNPGTARGRLRDHGKSAPPPGPARRPLTGALRRRSRGRSARSSPWTRSCCRRSGVSAGVAASAAGSRRERSARREVGMAELAARRPGEPPLRRVRRVLAALKGDTKGEGHQAWCRPAAPADADDLTPT